MPFDLVVFRECKDEWQ
eukprot:IDg10075t1